jgi:gamma-glutamylcyclotransferase (GGCT)/AIG2-like uncharacterized protein YtfP
VPAYFAYGSNMAPSVVTAWSGAHALVGPARLEGFRLEFRRRSVRWSAGAADVVERPGETVWGALYEIPAAGMARLDEKESAGTGYRRRRVAVIGPGGRRCEAVVYEVIDKSPAELAPAPEYLALILEAAHELGLPERYVRSVRERGRRLLTAAGRSIAHGSPASGRAWAIATAG